MAKDKVVQYTDASLSRIAGYTRSYRPEKKPVGSALICGWLYCSMIWLSWVLAKGHVQYFETIRMIRLRGGEVWEWY